MRPLKAFWFFLALSVCGLVMFGVGGLHYGILAFLNACGRADAAKRARRAAAWHRRWNPIVLGLFFRLGGCRFTYRLPEQRRSGPVLAIANHRSEIDFLLVSEVLLRLGYGHVRFIAKAGVADVPLIGRVARDLGSAFLVRRGDPRDVERVHDCCSAAESDASAVLLFPEGTVFGAPALRTVSAVAYQEVLPPRLNGFRAASAAMPEAALLSVTLDFHGERATGIGLLSALFGRRLTVEAEYREMPSAAAADGWLLAEWRRKDERLVSTTGGH